MPYVEVRDGDGNLVQTYQIAADAYGTLVTDENLFDMAKWNAVDDELVSPDQADKLTCRLVEKDSASVKDVGED